MPVEIGDVEVVTDVQRPEEKRPDVRPQSGAPDPQLATEIHRTMMLLRSRDLRLSAD